MKNLILLVSLLFSLSSFSQTNDVIKIKNDSLDYEIIIFYPGFDIWLSTSAKPRGFYSLQYLEIRNKYYVSDWNNKYMSVDRNLNYQFYIEYDSNVRYGYEVNYLLYNYFQYFMLRSRERIGIKNRISVLSY